MSRIIDELKRTDHKRYLGGLDFFKYIGPGLLVTVGFIDPGNWASNFAAGSEFGYALLWVVTLSTIMLIVFQHNMAQEPLPCRCFWKFPLPGDLSLLRCLSSLCFFPIHIKR